jgi:endoglucanase
MKASVIGLAALFLWAAGNPGSPSVTGDGVSPWVITPEEYLDSPGVSVLVFHDYYPEGKQGGVEIIQHGERVAAVGDVRLEETPGQWGAMPGIGKRQVDRTGSIIRVPAAFVEPKLEYEVRVEPAGAGFRIAVDLARPLPAALEGRASFNLELFPSAYFGKTYHLGPTSAIFPRQGNGPMVPAGPGFFRPAALASGPKISLAPEDPLRMMVIESLTAELRLYDGRNMSDNGWFVLRSALLPGRTRGAVEWIVTPNRVPDWHRDPVIAISQVGYHPDQMKRAVLELDRDWGPPAEAVLYRVDPTGGLNEVLRGPAERWKGKFLRYDYAFFDFTRVREPGMYVLKYGTQDTPPFRIGRDIYRNDVWQPTLETYLPVQMCHMEVRDVVRIWHGACHLDDAVQAPPSTMHFDSYQQGAVLKDSFPSLGHVPYLDR